MSIEHIVFDIGGVLIDWNPRYLYEQLIPEPNRRTDFLTTICSAVWNAGLDTGRDWLDAEAELIKNHPEWTVEIEAYRVQRRKMVGGPFEGAFALLGRCFASDMNVSALSNWNDVAFRELQQDYPELRTFVGTTVSGIVGIAKPDPEIYRIHEVSFGLRPRETVFIDDNAANIEAARQRGWHVIHHRTIVETESVLKQLCPNL